MGSKPFRQFKSVRLVLPTGHIRRRSRKYQDRRSRDRRRSLRELLRLGPICRRRKMTRPMMNATQTTSGGVSAARSCQIAPPSRQPAADSVPAGLVSSRAQRRCSFHRSGKRRNSMRVLPKVLGFTRSRSRNSATPSS